MLISADPCSARVLRDVALVSSDTFGQTDERCGWAGRSRRTRQWQTAMLTHLALEAYEELLEQQAAAFFIQRNPSNDHVQSRCSSLSSTESSCDGESSSGTCSSEQETESDDASDRSGSEAAQCNADDETNGESLDGEAQDDRLDWTREDIELFFVSLARRSRLRPDLIAADLCDSKSVGDVVRLLALFNERLAIEQEHISHPSCSGDERCDLTSCSSSQDRSARQWKAIKGAVEMSEAWLAFENEAAQQLALHDGQSVAYSDEYRQTFVKGRCLGEEDQHNISWQEQVLNALLFLRHHFRLQKESDDDVHCFPSSLAIKVFLGKLNSSKRDRHCSFHSFARIHPVPPMTGIDEARDRRVATLILLHGIESGILGLEEGNGSQSPRQSARSGCRTAISELSLSSSYIGLDLKGTTLRWNDACDKLLCAVQSRAVHRVLSSMGALDLIHLSALSYFSEPLEQSSANRRKRKSDSSQGGTCKRLKMDQASSNVHRFHEVETCQSIDVLSMEDASLSPASVATDELTLSNEGGSKDSSGTPVSQFEMIGASTDLIATAIQSVFTQEDMSQMQILDFRYLAGRLALWKMRISATAILKFCQALLDFPDLDEFSRRSDCPASSSYEALLDDSLRSNEPGEECARDQDLDSSTCNTGEQPNSMMNNNDIHHARISLGEVKGPSIYTDLVESPSNTVRDTTNLEFWEAIWPFKELLQKSMGSECLSSSSSVYDGSEQRESVIQRRDSRLGAPLDRMALSYFHWQRCTLAEEATDGRLARIEVDDMARSHRKEKQLWELVGQSPQYWQARAQRDSLNQCQTSFVASSTTLENDFEERSRSLDREGTTTEPSDNVYNLLRHEADANLAESLDKRMHEWLATTVFEGNA